MAKRLADPQSIIKLQNREIAALEKLISQAIAVRSLTAKEDETAAEFARDPKRSDLKKSELKIEWALRDLPGP